MSPYLITFVDYLVTALTFAIFGRVIMSWVSPTGNDPISPLLYQITEPILQPIRQLVPRMGMFDLTPMIAIFILFAISRLIHSMLLA